MGRRVLQGLLMGVALTGVAAAVTAQRVALEADRMPLEEALRELARQTGYEFSTMGVFTTRDQPSTVTGSFRDAPLKRVLEAICEQTGRRYDRTLNARFMLLPRRGTAPKPPRVDVEGGYRVRIRSLSFALGKQDFDSSPELVADPRMTIDFVIDAPEDEAAARVFGMGDSLAVVDNTGQTLRPCNVSALGHTPIYLNGLSDPTEIYGKLDVAFPRPDAKSISLSGAIVLWRKCERVEIEAPWVPAGAVGEAHGITLRVFGAAPSAMGSGIAVSVEQPGPRLPLGAQAIRTEVSENRLFARWADGRRRALPALAGLLRGRGTVQVEAPSEAEGPPEALIYSTYLKEDPTVVVPFALEGIPLPDFPEWAEPLAEKAAASSGQPHPPHAYWAEGEAAGAVGFDVQVGGRAVPGPLEIGVSMLEHKDNVPVGEYAQWDAVLDAAGHVRVGNLRPGTYEFHILASGMGPRGVRMEERLAQHFGIDPKRCTWVNTRAALDLHAGETLHLDPVRFVPAVIPLRPDPDAVLNAAEVEFAWEAYPGAVSYRASLGIRDAEGGVIFWASDETTETVVRYDPTKGQVYSEAYRRYLSLTPDTQYYWWVTALDAAGRTLSQGHGGGYFRVK